jgi:ribosome maturation factor RimP
MTLPIEKVTPAIERKLAEMGLELFEIKLIQAGSRRILRIYIDRATGVTIGDCEMASNEISMVLDVEGFTDRPYTLEVSSPGIDRPLTTEKDFRREVNRNLRLQVRDQSGGVRTVRGKLQACSDGALVLETDKGTVSVSLSDVHSGKVEVSFK